MCLHKTSQCLFAKYGLAFRIHHEKILQRDFVSADFLSKKIFPRWSDILTIRYLQLRGMKRTFAIPSECSKKTRRLPCVEIYHKLDEFPKRFKLTIELFHLQRPSPHNNVHSSPVFNLLTRKK